MPHFRLSLSLLFQALMLVHYFRRRPEGYWFFVIIFLGPLGALVYFIVEVIPDLRVKPPVIARFERARRQRWLETVVAETPSVEALQELGEIYAAEGEHERAVPLFDRALQRDPASREALYGRGTSWIALGQLDRAIPDLQAVVQGEFSYHFYGAALALAEAYEKAGNDSMALATYQDILGKTTVSRAYYGYGSLLARLGRKNEAKEMMQQILAKKANLPRYLRRQERPWFRKAEAVLKTLP